MIMCIQNLGLILPIHSQDIERKKQILKSIKGRNSFANLHKMTLFNPNVDLVNDNVYTKFSLILSICFQDIGRKPNYAGMTE